MSPRRTASPPAEPEAPVIRRCRHCHREMEPGRQVFCSTTCIEIADQRAALVGGHMGALQRAFDAESASIEDEIARFAAERRRILHGRRDDLMAMSAELAPLRVALDEAKGAGEIRFPLASDRPDSAETGWR